MTNDQQTIVFTCMYAGEESRFSLLDVVNTMKWENENVSAPTTGIFIPVIVPWLEASEKNRINMYEQILAYEALGSC